MRRSSLQQGIISCNQAISAEFLWLSRMARRWGPHGHGLKTVDFTSRGDDGMYHQSALERFLRLNVRRGFVSRVAMVEMMAVLKRSDFRYIFGRSAPWMVKHTKIRWCFQLSFLDEDIFSRWYFNRHIQNSIHRKNGPKISKRFQRYSYSSNVSRASLTRFESLPRSICLSGMNPIVHHTFFQMG